MLLFCGLELTRLVRMNVRTVRQAVDTASRTVRLSTCPHYTYHLLSRQCSVHASKETRLLFKQCNIQAMSLNIQCIVQAMSL